LGGGRAFVRLSVEATLAREQAVAEVREEAAEARRRVDDDPSHALEGRRADEIQDGAAERLVYVDLGGRQDAGHALQGERRRLGDLGDGPNGCGETLDGLEVRCRLRNGRGLDPSLRERRSTLLVFRERLASPRGPPWLASAVVGRQPDEQRAVVGAELQTQEVIGGGLPHDGVDLDQQHAHLRGGQEVGRPLMQGLDGLENRAHALDSNTATRRDFSSRRPPAIPYCHVRVRQDLSREALVIVARQLRGGAVAIGSCRGAERKREIVARYVLRPVVHAKLLDGQEVDGCCGLVTDRYYFFEAEERASRQREVFHVGYDCAEQFLELIGHPRLPLFNPLHDDAPARPAGHGGQERGAEPEMDALNRESPVTW
jgi:hypothetical protein